jgi:SSS family solute:Na+ symporter
LIENISFADNLIIFIYFIIAMSIGLIAAMHQDKSPKDYFLAGRNVGWLLIGSSLFATNISSEHFVGLAGAGSVHGLSVGHFEWIAIFILFILGWLFAPVFIKADVYTMPEFLGKKFGGKTRSYLTAVSLAAYFFTKIAVTLIAGGYLLSKILGLDMITFAVFIVLLTGLYTVIGGLASVLKTQLFQSIVLIIGSLLLTIYGLADIGGISVLTEKLPSSYFEIFKPLSDPDFPWTGVLFGAPILGIWYWCTDQYIVQRLLSAKNISSARKGTLLAAALKLVPIVLLLIPGLIAAVKYPNVKGDSSFAYLISGSLLPAGIKGLVIAGFFAALMSSLASAFNSSATLLAMDVFRVKKPHTSDSELILIGRLATIFIVVLAILFVPLLRIIDSQIYIYLQKIQAFISPPIASAFIFGVFWKKAKSKGIFWSLVIGGAFGFVRIITSYINPAIINNIQLLKMYNDIQYLHFAAILFIVSSAILIGVSLLSKETQKPELSDFSEFNLEEEIHLELETTPAEKI